MPSANVAFPGGPMPLTRLNPWYPGQFGVPGTDNETGLRMHCTGAVFWVDPNFPGVSDLRDGTNPTNPLETVGAAQALCQPYRGDTIAVMANNNWIYGDTSLGYATTITESVTVTVPGVKIVGVSPSSAIGVYWDPAAAGGTAITVQASDVLIEGFAFMGFGTNETAIHAEWNGDTYGDIMTVRNCYFEGGNQGLDNGITLDYSWYHDIHNNFFDECLVYGIYNAAADSDSAYLRIHHNQFHDIGTTAIMLPDGDRCEIYENSFYNVNAATGVAAPDAFIDTGSGAGSRNFVHNNKLSCALGAGAGGYDNTCSASGTDAWVQNFCLNGPTVGNPL